MSSFSLNLLLLGYIAIATRNKNETLFSGISARTFFQFSPSHSFLFSTKMFKTEALQISPGVQPVPVHSRKVNPMGFQEMASKNLTHITYLKRVSLLRVGASGQFVLCNSAIGSLSTNAQESLVINPSCVLWPVFAERIKLTMSSPGIIRGSCPQR